MPLHSFVKRLSCELTSDGDWAFNLIQTEWFEKNYVGQDHNHSLTHKKVFLQKNEVAHPNLGRMCADNTIPQMDEI